jgi:hypothetical protein
MHLVGLEYWHASQASPRTSSGCSRRRRSASRAEQLPRRGGDNSVPKRVPSSADMTCG